MSTLDFKFKPGSKQIEVQARCVSNGYYRDNEVSVLLEADTFPEKTKWTVCLKPPSIKCPNWGEIMASLGEGEVVQILLEFPDDDIGIPFGKGRASRQVGLVAVKAGRYIMNIV